MKAIRKDPTRRYASALAFKEDLDRYLSNYPIKAKNESHLYGLLKLIQRQKTMSVLIVMLLGTAVFSVIKSYDERQILRKQALQNSQVSRFFESFFDRLDPYQVRNGNVLVKDLLTQQFKQVENSFQEFPDTRVAILTRLAGIYQKIGILEYSEKTYSLIDQELKTNTLKEDSSIFLAKAGQAQLRVQQSKLELAADLINELNQLSTKINISNSQKTLLVADEHSIRDQNIQIR